MKLLRAAAAGFAGATALNILHETVRKLDSGVPRIDKLGAEALTKTADALNIDAPTGDHLYEATLIGDVASNTAYYTMIGMGGSKGIVLRALTLGLTAGIGALKLPEPLGLNKAPVASTDKKKLLTVAYYVFGALVTAAVFQLSSKK